MWKIFKNIKVTKVMSIPTSPLGPSLLSEKAMENRGNIDKYDAFLVFKNPVIKNHLKQELPFGFSILVFAE